MTAIVLILLLLLLHLLLLLLLVLLLLLLLLVNERLWSTKSLSSTQLLEGTKSRSSFLFGREGVNTRTSLYKGVCIRTRSQRQELKSLSLIHI